MELDDEGLRVRLGDDFRRVFAPCAGPEIEPEPGVTYVTPFGVKRTGLGYGQPLGHPLADATLEEIDAYAWPDPAWVDVSNVRSEAEAYGGEYAILGGDWSPFWHDLIDLLGMEDMYLKMYDRPELVDAVLGHLVDYYAAVSRNIFDAAADSLDVFFMGNDFGSQRGALLSEADLELIESTRELLSTHAPGPESHAAEPESRAQDDPTVTVIDDCENAPGPESHASEPKRSMTALRRADLDRRKRELEI